MESGLLVTLSGAVTKQLTDKGGKLFVVQAQRDCSPSLQGGCGGQLTAQ